MPIETEHISVQAVQQLYDGLSESNRQTIADTLEQAGFQVTVNVWGWKGFVEV